MAGIPLTELIVSVVGDNKQVLNMFREIEDAKKQALDTGDDSGLRRELEQLAKTATEANRRLDPLAGQARATAQEMQALSVAIKTGAVSLNDGLKRYQALEAVSDR
jgi:ABC-type tungstate transport system permease subunit